MANMTATANNVDLIHLESALVDSSIGGMPLVPGCQLPTETLIQIFLEALSTVISDRINGRSKQCIHPTLAIASVCHRWRDIALGTPDLWGYIPINGLKIREHAGKINGITKMICTLAKHTMELFLDFTYAFSGEGTSNYPSHRGMESVIFAVEAAFGTHGILSPHITIYWPSWNNATVHLGWIAQTYIANRQYNYRLYNILPDFSDETPNQVHSLVLHLASRPAPRSIFTLLNQRPNLVHFKVAFPDPTYGVLNYDPASFPASFPANPLLQSLSTRLSMMPVVFNRRQSISKRITSLHITLDKFPWRMTPEDWDLTADSSGLSSSVQRLELEVVPYMSMTKEMIYQVIVKLTSVVILSLHGRSVSVVLDMLLQHDTLLPALRRLEMAFAAIDPARLTALLHSCREVSIGELVFDRCSNITREYCDEMKEMVERVIVY